MAFEFNTPTRATLMSLTPRTEKHGDEDVFAVSFGLKLTGPNTLLDKLSPALRHAFYRPEDEAQNALPEIGAATPVLRAAGIELVSLKGALQGWTIEIQHGIDEDDPIVLGDAKIDNFRVHPMNGGTVELMFRVGSSDIDATEAGLLCSFLRQEVDFTLRAPLVKADGGPIDGSVGHPGLAAQRAAEEAGQRRLDDEQTPEAAFAAAAGGGDDEPDEDEEEGAAPDATPAKRRGRAKAAA